MRPARLFISLLLAATALSISAQPAAFRLEEVVLPARTPVATIDCIFEDSRGFMWIGAYTGLYRYDGYELQHFQHKPEDPYSISDNKIKVIAENSDGTFWVGTQVGMNYFDPKTQRFKHYSDPAAAGIGKVEIEDMQRDKNGVLWASASDGLYRFDPDEDRFLRVFPAAGAAGKGVLEIEPAETGIYFSSDQIYLLEADNHVRPLGIPVGVGTVVKMRSTPPTATARKGLLLVGANKGFFCVDRATHAIRELTALRGVWTYSLTRMGARWLVSTDKGQYYLDPATLQVEGPLKVQMDGGIRQANDLSRGYTASNGAIWLTTNTRKLYQSDPLKARFHHAPIDLMEPLKTPASFCELFEFQPGMLLIPRKEGATLFELETGKTIPFPFRPGYNLEGWNGGVVVFLEEENGKLWIGTIGGLFLFDRNQNRFVDLELDFPEMKRLRGVWLRKIHRDRKGNLWVATWKTGVFKIDFKNKTMRQFLISAADYAAYSYAARNILEARDGTLWIGTRGGLFHYFEAQDSFRVYQNIPGDPRSMSENTAFCIYEDDEGYIWTGSYGGGLNRLDLKTDQFVHFTTDEGLLNNNVFSLLPDSRKNLWMLTYNGITLFDPVQKTFRTFTHDQGLLNANFEGFLYGRSRYSNTFFFGGTKGIDYCNPDGVSANQPPPKVYFTGFRMFNDPVPIGGDETGSGRFFLPQDIVYTQEITLRYDQNVISFDYAALDFSSPGTIQYAYQLVGFDTSWQYVGSKRSVTFTNLDPGSYTLRVKASNSDGVWDADEANVRSVKITVTPPWWRTWWFQITVSLLLAALAVSFYQYRIRQIREREAMKTQLNQRIAQVKMEALRSQMNPHFVFNCLSSLKLFVEKNETEKASDHISKFATLLRRVLDDARTETETVALDRELDTLKRYVELEMIRFKDKFEFRLDVQPALDLASIEIPPLILQPYVENAILHGLQHKTDGKGLLLVQVRRQGDLVEIVIEDNGVGRAAAAAIKARNPVGGPSHGLNVTAERLDYFSQKYQTQTVLETTDLFDADGAPAGTRVTLTVQTDEPI